MKSSCFFPFYEVKKRDRRETGVTEWKTKTQPLRSTASLFPMCCAGLQSQQSFSAASCIINEGDEVMMTGVYLATKLGSTLHRFIWIQKNKIWCLIDPRWVRTRPQNSWWTRVHSPLYCPPVCTASSCVPCRWTWAGTTSANRSCRSDPEWRRRWSWSARPGRPPATGTCLRWEETSLQLLQAEEERKAAYVKWFTTSCVCVCVCVGRDEIRFGGCWKINCIAWPLILN